MGTLTVVITRMRRAVLILHTVPWSSAAPTRTSVCWKNGSVMETRTAVMGLMRGWGTALIQWSRQILLLSLFCLFCGIFFVWCFRGVFVCGVNCILFGLVCWWSCFVVFAWCEVFFFFFIHLSDANSSFGENSPFWAQTRLPKRFVYIQWVFLVVGDTFYITISTNSPLPAFSQTFKRCCVCVHALVSNYKTVYLHVFAVLSIVANHRHLCWKQWPVRGVSCRLIRRITFEQIYSSRLQIYLI